MLDYMLKEKGFKDYSVGTIEGSYFWYDGSPSKGQWNEESLVDAIYVCCRRPCEKRYRRWLEEELEKKGYEVSVFMEGLGQNPDIQKIFIEHARFMAKHKMIDIVDKKKAYAVEKD